MKLAGDRPDEPVLTEMTDVDAEIVAGNPPPSSRVRLSRDRIVDTAITYIDDEGLSDLTMRRLGQRLGVEAMSMYRYIPGKEELLDAVVEKLIAQMQRDSEVLEAPERGWQDFLQRLAHGIRRVSLQHPKAFPLVASRPLEAPWLRPPLRSLEWVEAFLAGLSSEGFSDDAAVAGYKAFTSFLLGHLLLEVAMKGADLGPLDVIEDKPERPDSLAGFPSVRRLRDGLSADHAAAEFEEALEHLLARMTHIRQHL